MKDIDTIVFGDNQFFGINHSSYLKAAESSRKFSSNEAIFAVYKEALELGVSAVMLNSNERAEGICDFFRARGSQVSEVAFYPSIPYPHKYANLVAELGIPRAAAHLFGASGKSGRGLVANIGDAGLGLITKDPVRLMRSLVDMEMTVFRGLNVNTVFLQNVVVDLLLGLDAGDLLSQYCEYIRRRYSASPGFITQNLPMLLDKFSRWGISEFVVCASFNSAGYLMSPSIDGYLRVRERTDRHRYKIMAMSVLASGALDPGAAYKFIGSQQIDSVVFGASNRKNIEASVNMLRGELKKGRHTPI